MDSILSQLIPTHKIGNDGFNWWVGQVEGTAPDEKNNKGGYRFKVRIVGDHPESKEILDTANLPWATVMMPVNVPFMPGNAGGAHPQLVIGCWVIGFYLDNSKQKPIIMGSIGQTPGATSVVNIRRPDSKSFLTAISDDANPSTDGQPAPENEEGGQSEETNRSTGGLPDGTKDGEGKDRAPLPLKKTQGMSDEKWCQSVADKCDKEDLSSRTKILLGEFLAEVQNNNGNIGTYLVSSVSGTINSGVAIARKYINKFMKVIRHFVAKIKGFVIEKLTAGVKDLIKALIYPNETGNALTPVTEWFNNLLKDLGCQMADLGDRLAEWLTNVLMGYVNTIYRAAACQVDALVNGILSKINSLMEEILGKVLGPIQDILGAIASPLNILGQAINFVLNLLGISCSGPNNDCAKYRKICTDGEEDEEGKDKDDFLDNLLSDIDNLFPATGADYTQYTCEDAYTGNSLKATTVGFTGGVTKPGGNNDQVTKIPRIRYNITDIETEEGNQAIFTVTREGRTDVSSSVTYKTLDKGTATPEEDYLPEEGILGFAPGEKEKTISIRTIYSVKTESDEDFYIILRQNSPGSGSGIRTNFIANAAKCTITERDLKDPLSPYNPITSNPIDQIDVVFPPDQIDVPPTDDTGDVPAEDDTTQAYRVIANRSTCPEGEFIVYTITTQNVENGSIVYYTLSGNGITSEDIVGGGMTGQIFINDNAASVTIGIEDDGVVEDQELLRFTLNGTGAIADVLLTTDSGDDSNDIGDFDDGEGNKDETNPAPFIPPSVNPGKIITDPGGGIIDIPVDNPGDPWTEPPYVFIGGEGIGAVATPLLDQDGFITEIRIKAPGYGYKLNTAENNGVRCIIDDFTLIRPGFGYTYTPDVYIDGELNIAEAVINDDGFVIGVKIKDRARTFKSFPEIKIIGGGGYGAKVLPSLVCLDTQQLTTIGSTKIGTGQYIDCP